MLKLTGRPKTTEARETSTRRRERSRRHAAQNMATASLALADAREQTGICYRNDETRLWRDGLSCAFHAVTEDIAVPFDPASEREPGPALPVSPRRCDPRNKYNRLSTPFAEARGFAISLRLARFSGWVLSVLNAEGERGDSRRHREASRAPRTNWLFQTSFTRPTGS